MRTKRNPLTEIKIKENWNKKPMYIVWNDGSDSMCQDNKYTLDYILEMNRQGCEVFLDE